MRAVGRDISQSMAPIMTSVMPSQSARMGSTGDNLGALSVASRAGVSLKTRGKCGLGQLRPGTDGPGPGERQKRRGGELRAGNSASWHFYRDKVTRGLSSLPAHHHRPSLKWQRSAPTQRRAPRVLSSGALRARCSVCGSTTASSAAPAGIQQ